VLINVPAVEACYDFALQQRLERTETHDATFGRLKHTFYGDQTPIAVAMIRRRARELRLIGKPMGRRKLHDSREISCRHSLEYLDGGGLEREEDGLAGRQREIASGLGGHSSHQLDAPHVGADVDAGAAALDRHPRYPAGKNVARRRGQGLEPDEDIGRSHREYGGPNAIRHHRHVDGASPDMDVLHSFAGGKVDQERTFRTGWGMVTFDIGSGGFRTT